MKAYINVSRKEEGETYVVPWVRYGPRGGVTYKRFSGKVIPTCGKKLGMKGIYWPMIQLHIHRGETW